MVIVGCVCYRSGQIQYIKENSFVFFSSSRGGLCKIRGCSKANVKAFCIFDSLMLSVLQRSEASRLFAAGQWSQFTRKLSAKCAHSAWMNFSLGSKITDCSIFTTVKRKLCFHKCWCGQQAASLRENQWFIWHSVFMHWTVWHFGDSVFQRKQHKLFQT